MTIQCLYKNIIINCIFCFIALASLTLTSCKKDKNTGTQTYILAVNSAEGSVPQDFIIDDHKANIYPLAYTQTTAPVGVKAGNKTLKFISSGTTTVNSTTSLNAEPGNYYSAFYLEDKSIITLRDDQTDPQSGKARVRFINLSPAITTNVDFGITAGSKIVKELAPKIASSYLEVNAGTAFALYPAASATALLQISASVQAGHVYTIYISGATEATLSYRILANR